MDLKERGIRVNCISPGPIDTPIMGKMGLSDEQVKGFVNHVSSQVPMGHMGQPADIAGAALFLASDDSAFISGLDLCVDGGMAQV
jgi:NAD(P)-dependent dehydrogenase (short-subunit alcohol dehydrogenase family)